MPMKASRARSISRAITPAVLCSATSPSPFPRNRAELPSISHLAHAFGNPRAILRQMAGLSAEGRGQHVGTRDRLLASDPDRRKTEVVLRRRFHAIDAG